MWFSFFVLALKLYAENSSAAELRIAVLDNLQSQKLASEKYQKNYFKGIEIAARYAKAKQISLQIEHFEYGKGDLDILKEIDGVKKWQPDAIIGPRSSGKFLLLKDQFISTLVISPLATSTEISKLPNNFFSITPDNNDAAKIMANYVKNNFKGKSIVAFTEADCKSCNDFTKTIATEKTLNIKAISYLGSEIEKVESKNLISEIRQSDLILLSATSYSAGLLLAKIVNSFPRITNKFLGNDEWGSFNASYVGKIPVENDFEAIRIVPWSLKSSGDSMKVFDKFATTTDQQDIDEISLVSFTTVKTIVDSYLKGYDKKLTPSAAIIAGLEKSRKRNPHFGRPQHYSIFRRIRKSEVYLRQTSSKEEKL